MGLNTSAYQFPEGVKVLMLTSKALQEFHISPLVMLLEQLVAEVTQNDVYFILEKVIYPEGGL